MLDIAWPELAVIGAVALVAIGPKDLPRVMRTLGKWVGKARAMAREFQGTIDRLSYETEIAETLKESEKKSEEKFAARAEAVKAEKAAPSEKQDHHE